MHECITPGCGLPARSRSGFASAEAGGIARHSSYMLCRACWDRVPGTVKLTLARAWVAVRLAPDNPGCRAGFTRTLDAAVDAAARRIARA